MLLTSAYVQFLKHRSCHVKSCTESPATSQIAYQAKPQFRDMVLSLLSPVSLLRAATLTP